MYPTPLGMWIGLILGLAFIVDGLRGVVLVIVFGGFGWFVEKVAAWRDRVGGPDQLRAGHMTAPTSAPSTELDQPPDATAASPFRTERGFTSIAPAVVEKIAGRAATEVDGVGVVAPAGLRKLFSSTPAPDTPADADARVGMERASVALSISIRYPAPVRAKSAEVRAIVAERVEQYTGLHVSWVDLTVAQLPTADPWKPRRRVE